MVDQLWSTESLEIVDDGGRLTRGERIERIAAHPVVQQTLRVCWENPDGAYNCGRCRKCMMTMISLEAIGARERSQTFPPELDLDLLDGFELTQPIRWCSGKTCWRRRTAGGPISSGRSRRWSRGAANLGLPPSYRARRTGRPCHRPQNSCARAQRAQLEATSPSSPLMAPLGSLALAASVSATGR